MKKFEFILLVVFCLLGINNMAYTQEQDTVVIKDSIAKKNLLSSTGECLNLPETFIHQLSEKT